MPRQVAQINEMFPIGLHLARGDALPLADEVLRGEWHVGYLSVSLRGRFAALPTTLASHTSAGEQSPTSWEIASAKGASQ